MIKIKRLAPFSAGLMLLSPMVMADDLANLEAQVNELKSELQEIKKNGQRAPGKPGFIPIPGTDTDLRLYGVARAQIAYSIDGGFGHTQAVTGPFNKGYGGVAWDGSAQAERSGQLEFDARASRLGFETITPTKLGDVRTLIETDFYGTGGSKISTNAVALRLRHAYVEVGSLLIGQTWSNSTDLGSSPWLLDLGGPVGLPAVARVPQIRYTHKPSQNHALSFALEQSVQDFRGADGVSFGAGTSNISENSIDESFELVSRYTYSNDWFRQSFSAIGRKLTYDTGLPGERDSVFGYALTYQGKFTTFGRSNVYYSGTYSDGANNYITQQNTSSAILENDELYKVKAYGINVGYTQAWKPNWTSTFNLGMKEVDIPDNTAAYGSTVSSSKSFFSNLMWNPIPNATLAIEYQYAEIENDDGDEGSGQRVYLTSMYKF